MLSITNEKCIPAALPEFCIPRRALMEKMKQAAENRFLYLGAPAGSGKTVSALLWNSVSGRKALWIGLDAYDNMASVFYKLLSAVICSTQSDNQNMIAVLSDPAFSSAPVENTIRLISELQPDERLFSLTLDDFHLLQNQDILKSLPAVLKRLPVSFSVLFLSRTDLPESLRQLIEDGNVISADNLKFSKKELLSYFTNRGRPLSDEEAEIALAATGGLAININAAAKTGGIERGETEYVFANFIKEHLWEKWDLKLREFMLKTSVVDEMTLELATALTGKKDAGKTLNELCANNTFTTKVSSSRGLGKDTYRYHHLFLAFLRDMAKESGINLAVLYKAAAKYYSHAGKSNAALRYAIQSDDGKIIEQAMIRFNQYTGPNQDEFITYAKMFYFDSLTEKVCDKYPYLYKILASAAWLSGDAKAGERYCDKIMAHLRKNLINNPRLQETIIVSVANDYRKTMEHYMSKIAIPKIIVNFQKRVQLLTLTFQLPFFHRSNRDYYEAGDPKIVASLDRNFSLLLKDLWPTIRCCVTSGALLERNQMNEALDRALEAKKLMSQTQNTELIFNVYNHLSAAYLAMGNDVLLKETLAEMEHFVKQTGGQYFYRNFLAWKTKIRLWDADKKAAQEWLDNYFVTDEKLVPLYKYFQILTTARACIVLGDGNRAMILIDQLIQFAKDYRRPLDLGEARTLKACLEWACGNHSEAAACLEEALQELQDVTGGPFIRPIADEGASVVPVLKRICAGLNAEASDGKLNKSYVNEVLLAAHEVSGRHRGITAYFKKSNKPVKLSKQQKKMIDFLAQGYSYGEITRLTGLTLPTVRSHLMLAYKKLDVDNKMDAVIKAREMGVI
jgi:LuxR family maltose regulon positive regulatory protein